jgi:hypothetical protein
MDTPASLDPAALLDYVTHLSITAFAILTALIAAADVVTAVLAAVRTNSFTLALIAQYLTSHVLQRLFPIIGQAVLGHGFATAGMPPIPFFAVTAAASLVAYFLETVHSIQSSVVAVTNAGAISGVLAATAGPAPVDVVVDPAPGP